MCGYRANAWAFLLFTLTMPSQRAPSCFDHQVTRITAGYAKRAMDCLGGLAARIHAATKESCAGTATPSPWGSPQAPLSSSSTPAPCDRDFTLNTQSETLILSQMKLVNLNQNSSSGQNLQSCVECCWAGLSSNLVISPTGKGL